MRNICFIIAFFCFGISAFAQNDSLKKRPTLGVHFFYNDFASPQQIRGNGLGKVLQNNLWNRPQKIQGGFGLDYFQGITKKIDAIGTINTSWVNYLVPPTPTPYGSSHLMLDINAGINTKLLSDKHVVSPYLITKAGFSSFKSQNGFNLIPGLGVQFNLFKEIFVNTTFEYRVPLGKKLSPQLYYSIGIAKSIFKKKAPKPIKEKPIVEKPVVKEPEPAILLTKNVSVIITDEATGQPLEYAEVTLKGDLGNVYTINTNQDGKALFRDIPKDNYSVVGRLNRIDATSANISLDDYKKQGNQLEISLTHNDPRFTLVGNTIDKNVNLPIGNTSVSITNSSQNSTGFVTSKASDGEFRSQLESASDFVVFGKKASYISNIENISTKGLNRSTTLYVKLQLGIEEAKAGKSIVLNKIFFETGKSNLNMVTSQDLQKLTQFMLDNPAVKLEIQGHTDNVGSLETNLRLSQQRANSVVEYLVASRIARERMNAKGYGSNLPISSNKTTEGRSQNRRVEMKVLE